MNIASQSWQDIITAQPLDPRAILLNCAFGGGGKFIRSTTFLQATWGTNPFAFTGNNTSLTSLDTTDQATVVDALQWTFSHQMVNATATVGPIMRKGFYEGRADMAE